MLTLAERNELITNHLPFADKIATSQFRKTPPCVQWEELRSAAHLGLVDAATKYDGSKPFSVYASFRINGEITDYLRSLYWGGRRQTFQVSTLVEDYDYAGEPDEGHFEDLFAGLTKELSPLARKVLKMYYAQDATMKEIARCIGLSSTRVYQIIKENLASLRNRWRREEFFYRG